MCASWNLKLDDRLKQEPSPRPLGRNVKGLGPLWFAQRHNVARLAWNLDEICAVQYTVLWAMQFA